MAFLSIVLPVYGVAGYLEECLDSILDQTGADIEVIAVDDASTDGSAAILDRYAARDTRLRVMHLAENVGLGPARNIGLAEATGEYVWFVDSDDYLAPGALRAVARRLRETTPQVMLFDFAKVDVTGRTRRSPLQWRLKPLETPDVFSAVEIPHVLRPLHTAWSRVIRRDWLIGLDIPFQAAWYEDVSFTYPVTAAADRISVLYRVCYYYRQRAHGSITKSHGDDRHFHVFDQYKIVYDTLDKWEINDPGLREAMYTRMQYHFRFVFGGTERVPRSRRREYFIRMAADLRARRPAGMPPAGRMERLRWWLITRGAWRSFNAARVAKDTAGSMKRTSRKTRRNVVRVFQAGSRRLLHGYAWAQRRLPVDQHLAVYSAYWAIGYRCSPAAIYEKARELAPQIRGVWVVDKKYADTMPPGVDYVTTGSREHLRALARARYLINNVNFSHDHYRKRPGTTVVQTHHGTPLKAMGMEHHKYPVGGHGMNLRELLGRCSDWDVSISTSAFNTAVWQRAYPVPYRTMEIGYPRNDYLVNAAPGERDRIRRELGLAEGELAVLYAPTHRDWQGTFSPMLDVEELADELGENARVLMRAHYFNAPAGGVGSGGHPRVFDVSAYPKVEELYLATDVLITDYSSLMFDFAVLDRPMVIFAPDWDAYQRVRGVTFDLFETPPGVIATTPADLIDAFRTGEVHGDAAAKARTEFRERFCPHRDGKASERVVREIMLGESPA